MIILFDLDGTLIDARQRVYGLFQELVPSSSLAFDEYWELKRAKIDHRQILRNKYHYAEQEFLEFEKIWLDQIEEPRWLALDKPFAGVTEFLNKLRNDHLLYVTTARQKRDAALVQLTQFGWKDIFCDVFVSTPLNHKSQIIASAIRTQKDDWIVGDTGKDIETGKKLGIKTAAVLSGFLSKEMLLPYEPDIIIDTVLNLKI